MPRRATKGKGRCGCGGRASVWQPVHTPVHPLYIRGLRTIEVGARAFRVFLLPAGRGTQHLVRPARRLVMLCANPRNRRRPQCTAFFAATLSFGWSWPCSHLCRSTPQLRAGRFRRGFSSMWARERARSRPWFWTGRARSTPSMCRRVRCATRVISRRTRRDRARVRTVPRPSGSTSFARRIRRSAPSPPAMAMAGPCRVRISRTSGNARGTSAMPRAPT
jgi:hypothetical protein